MIALAIVVAALVLLAVTPVGVTVEYGEEGVRLSAFFGLIRIKIIGRKPEKLEKKEKRERKKELKKAKKASVKKEKPKREKIPGSERGFKTYLNVGLTLLGRLRRKLTIHSLQIFYMAAGDDAYDTAMTFGRVSAGLGALTPILENNFKIKKRDFRTSVSFTERETKIYVNASLSLLLCEIFYILAAALPLISLITRSRGKKKTDKADTVKTQTTDGETADN
jgi:hypothetical protein